MRLLIAALLSMTAPALASNIIYIGDSQSASDGTMLKLLQPALEANGDKIVAGNAACGTTIMDHLDGGPAHCNYPRIQHMTVVGGQARFSSGAGHVVPLQTLFASAPSADTVVVELGDNHYNDRDLAKHAKAMALKILSSGKKCVWIGPASISGKSAKCSSTLPKKRAVAETLEKTLAETVVNGKRCDFINSFKLTAHDPPHTTDPLCIHYPGNYPPWANAVKPALLKALNGDESPSVRPSSSSSATKQIR